MPRFLALATGGWCLLPRTEFDKVNEAFFYFILIEFEILKWAI